MVLGVRVIQKNKQQQMNLNQTLKCFIVIIKDYSEDRVVYPHQGLVQGWKKLLDKLQDFYKEMTRTTHASDNNKENYSIAKDQEEEEEE